MHDSGHYRYSQYLYTKEQSDTFRVWRLIILLKCAKCAGPAKLNSQLLTSKEKEKAYHVQLHILYMRCVRCTINIVHNAHLFCTLNLYI